MSTFVNSSIPELSLGAKEWLSDHEGNSPLLLKKPASMKVASFLFFVFFFLERAFKIGISAFAKDVKNQT